MSHVLFFWGGKNKIITTGLVIFYLQQKLADTFVSASFFIPLDNFSIRFYNITALYNTVIWGLMYDGRTSDNLGKHPSGREG